MRTLQITLIIAFIVLIWSCTKEVEIEPNNLYGTWKRESTDGIIGKRFNKDGSFEFLIKDQNNNWRIEDYYKKFKKIEFKIINDSNIYLTAIDSTNTSSYLQILKIKKLSKDRLTLNLPWFDETYSREK